MQSHFRIIAASLCITGLAIAQQPVAYGQEVTFESDVQPLLTRFGCNAGACHGKSRGQNGFALSLLGFDADFDYAALVQEGRGRRVFPAAPESSLLLLKATGALPHGGGVRFAPDSPHYQLLLDWIRDGLPRTPDDAAQLVRVVVDPAHQSLGPDESAILKVFAEYSDGRRRDVTDGSAFQSNDVSIAAVSDLGELKAGPIPGETAIMARYMNNIAVCAVTIPLPGNVGSDDYDSLPVHNRIDELAWDKLQLLGMLPSETCDDATFLRRASLRVIGRLPTPDETRAFLADNSTDKRARLIDTLLARPEYADFWANKWADLLRPNPYHAGIKAVRTLDAWLREAFRENRPYDQFARDLLTAQGSTWRNGATVIYRDKPATEEIASSVSQLFLGVRLECAKCHHHPFEIWSQGDFYGFAAFFARVGHDGGVSPPISGGEELIFVRSEGRLSHGRTGESVDPRLLLGEPLTIEADVDPREVLADWMTGTENPYFAKAMANRVWAEIMGQGIVEPVDDLRATNPASNGPLLDYLATDFREHGYDIKHLIRTIMTSHLFELSSLPGERNVTDQRNFSRYYRERLRAEVLLDAVNDVLDSDDNFDAMPPDSRSIELWTHRSPSLFLDTFGRPDPNLDPPYERQRESTTPQILHLMNSPELNDKLVRDTARPAQLATSDLPPERIIEEAYLLVYSRLPTAEELNVALAVFPPEGDRRHVVEDLFWALLNTPEFYFIN